MTTHSNILAWRIPMDRGAWVGYSPWGWEESDTTEWLSTAQPRNGEFVVTKGERRGVLGSSEIVPCHYLVMVTWSLQWIKIQNKQKYKSKIVNFSMWLLRNYDLKYWTKNSKIGIFYHLFTHQKHQFSQSYSKRVLRSPEIHQGNSSTPSDIRHTEEGSV